MLLLLIAIVVHIYFFIKFIQTRVEKYLWRFLTTAGVNVVIAGAAIVIAINKPDEIRQIQIPMLLWFMSGVMMFLMLALQTSIFLRVYRRAKLPENYHYNYFGKKVRHPSTVKPTEVVMFFSSMPLLVLSGAYFVAKIIRMFIRIFSCNPFHIIN